jgi:hypothetical protein
MGQLSEMNLDEWMMIMSTLMALPMMIILLVIVVMGKFPMSEEERYLALYNTEPDYWDESENDGADRPAGAEREVRRDDELRGKNSSI